MPSIIKVDQIQSDTGNVAISGNVSSTLRVSNTSFPLIVRSGGTNHITIFDTRSSTGVGTMIGANQDGNTYYDSNYNSTATAGGHVWRNAGNNILTLGATGLLTTTAGIRFPATQVADADANTLDDYEEGSWTPELNFNGGTTGITYSQRQGQYVKIGRQVTAWFFFLLSNKGSSTGLARIASFPFTASNPVAEYASPIYLYSGFSSVTSSTAIAYMDATTIFEIRPATTTANLNDTNFTNTSYFWGTAVYQTAT